MRMPRRETNIFSLSMMDVISGAMGAFLIIMIVLMRAYKEDQEITDQRSEVQKQLADLQHQIDEAKKKLQMTTDVDIDDLIARLDAMRERLENLQRRVNRLSDDLQAARNRVNQMMAENSALRQQIDDLERDKRELEDWQVIRDAMHVLVTWNAGFDADIDPFLEPSFKTDKDQSIRFNPDDTSGWMFRHDFGLGVTGRDGPSIGVSQSVHFNSTFKIFVALKTKETTFASIPVRTHVSGRGMFETLESVQLTPSHRWELVGIVTTDNTGKSTVRNATAEERAQARKDVASWLATSQPGD